ncbi:MAG: nucleotide exchange factor GrpE [Bacteroidales bacterium]
MSKKHAEKETKDSIVNEKVETSMPAEKTSEKLENQTSITEENKEVEDLKVQIAELNDKNLRLFSEFDNFRRRTAKEKLELIKNASESVVLSLLPVIDDFERALEAHKGEDQTTTREGIELIYTKLCGVLNQQGLKVLEIKEGVFDAEEQEAVAQVPAASEELKGKVVDVVQKGYVLNGKVIRFAKVVVAN